MSKVFVVQRPHKKLDLSSAETYGKIEYLFESYNSPSLSAAYSMVMAFEKLKNYKQDDYLLSTGGDPVGVIIATSVLCYLNFTKINFLRWERERGEGGARMNIGYYVPMPLLLQPIDPKYLTAKGA